MAGLRGQAREPKAGARARRNSQNLSSAVDFIDQTGVVYLDGDGFIQLNLAANGGLENATASLQINLDTDPGLTLSSTGLKVLLPAGSGLQLDATGLTVVGAAAQTDSSQNTVTLSAVTTAVTDPADTPVDADTLRDDLVANAIPDIEAALGALSTRDTELETAIETLAGEFNSLLAKLRTANLLNT